MGQEVVVELGVVGDQDPVWSIAAMRPATWSKVGAPRSRSTVSPCTCTGPGSQPGLSSVENSPVCSPSGPIVTTATDSTRSRLAMSPEVSTSTRAQS